ncbi:phosphatase and actin regulator 4B-like isoform X3 [Uloborus diversus]|uniref:phosphatase and actin regulator 4B-like isoform X3 n=1 Tax=Uloborus diversus TaxID=327109 RepID=UPI00240A18CE|nr:phosphatase and actin regulator 4B-like isoform X3 [Uloborus diversus]
MKQRPWMMVRKKAEDSTVKGKKANGVMKTGPVGSNSRSPTPSPMEGKHSRFAMLGRLFKPWKWKRKKKSDKFEQTSRTLERKISMRSTKDELIKKGVLLPDGSDKDQDGKLNDSAHLNHIPQINGYISDSGISESEKQRGVQNSFCSPSSCLDSYNTIVVTSSSGSTILTSASHNNAMPVIHNVSLLNLPDVEEVPSHDGETILSVLPEPPISVNDIGLIPPPPMFSNPSPPIISKFHSQSDPSEDQSDLEDVDSSDVDSQSPCIVYVGQHDPPTASNVEEIPAKEPHPMNAMPKKSALKKKGPFTCADFQRLSIVHRLKKGNSSGDGKENRPVPSISVSTSDDSDSESDSPILWKDYYGDDEEFRRVAKVARKDSLALKLAQRPDIQELIDKNIYIAHSEQESHETKEDVKKKLTRRLSLRPTPEELEQRNILKYQSDEELQKEKEQKKKTLIRKLSFRPTIEELKERKIIRFNDYVEVTQAQDYDRRADKPWTRLTQRDKAAIRKELNEFKSMEMEVHEDSRHLTRFYQDCRK